MSDPHWLVQELAGNAAWTAVGVGAAYAWNRREAIKRAVWRQPLVKRSAAHIRGTSSMNAKPTVIHLSGASGAVSGVTGTLTVGSERMASWDVLASVGSERTALWNIEAPSRNQLKRLGDELLELGAWYLHQR